MKLTITGIIYLDGCIPFIGTAISLTGRNLDVIFNKTLKNQQQIALLDTIEATGELMTSTHHGKRPAFAIYSMRTLRRETVGSVRRQLRAGGTTLCDKRATMAWTTGTTSTTKKTSA